MKTSLAVCVAALAFIVTACGDGATERQVAADGATAAASPTESPAESPAGEFEYVDPDAAYADQIAEWEAKARGPKGKYAGSLARDDGWEGNNIAVRDLIVDTCLNLTKYQDATYTAFYAWTYILNDIGRGNSELPRTKQAIIASYFVGAACPDLDGAMTKSFQEALESAGGL